MLSLVETFRLGGDRPVEETICGDETGVMKCRSHKTLRREPPGSIGSVDSARVTAPRQCPHQLHEGQATEEQIADRTEQNGAMGAGDGRR